MAQTAGRLRHQTRRDETRETRDIQNLDADEVKAIVQKIEPGLADDEIDTLIRRADTDGDGHIDYEEFSTILLNKDAGDHERVQVTKVKRKIATHTKKDVRLGASADESKDSAH